MVAPVIVLGVIAAASALAQYANSERGRRMNAAERRRMEGLINKLQAPEFDTDQLTPPELKILEQYTPEVAELIYEDNPKLVEAKGARALKGKQAEEAALARMQDIAAGRDVLGDVEVIKAINDAIEASGSQRQAILADMARQGVSPSSSAYGLMQSVQAGQSQKNMFNAALQAALSERSRRDRALGESASLGGKILGYETDLERMNAEAINAVNQRNTAARRQYLTNRANTLNEAQRYNIKERQRVAEENARNLFQEQIRAQDLRNKQIAARYQTERDKLGLMTGNARFPDIASEIQSQNQGIQGLSNAAMISYLASRQSEPQMTPQQSGVQQSQEVPVGQYGFATSLPA